MSDRALAKAGSRLVPGSVATLRVPPVWTPEAPAPEVEVVAGPLLPPQPAASRASIKMIATTGSRRDPARLKGAIWVFILSPWLFRVPQTTGTFEYSISRGRSPNHRS